MAEHNGQSGAGTEWTARGVQMVFSTGEAAALCRVSQQTIIRCFDSGRINGFKVPGSKFRRIPRAELVRFMQENGIDTAGLEKCSPRIVIVHASVVAAEEIRVELERGRWCEVWIGADAFEGGLLVGLHKPDALIVSPGVTGLEASAARRAVGDRPCRVFTVGAGGKEHTLIWPGEGSVLRAALARALGVEEPDGDS